MLGGNEKLSTRNTTETTLLGPHRTHATISDLFPSLLVVSPPPRSFWVETGFLDQQQHQRILLPCASPVVVFFFFGWLAPSDRPRRKKKIEENERDKTKTIIATTQRRRQRAIQPTIHPSSHQVTFTHEFPLSWHWSLTNGTERLIDCFDWFALSLSLSLDFSPSFAFRQMLGVFNQRINVPYGHQVPGQESSSLS